MSRSPVDYIERTREQYGSLGYPPYQWVHNEDEPPFATVSNRSRSRGSGSSPRGGLSRGTDRVSLPGRFQLPGHPLRYDTSALRVTHFAYDVTDARADPNVVFPIETLRAEAREGGIGAVGPNAYTFMGGIYSVRKVRQVLAPALAERVEEDAVDAVVARPRLTGVPSIRRIDRTRDRTPRDPDHLHVECLVDHRGRQPASRRVPGLPARTHGGKAA